MGERAAACVRFAHGVYSSVPTTDARVRLLAMARRAATECVVLRAAISGESNHVGRIIIDGPRRVLRAAGARSAEPGDRFGPRAYVHCFYDEEELLGEIARAGLVVTQRKGFTFVLRAGAETKERAASFAAEVTRVVLLVRDIDAARARKTPEGALRVMRDRGRSAAARGPIGRARLRRAIGWVDALSPGGASCYRRILLEVALDAGAAKETVVFGLDVGSTGHVAFEDREEKSFDVSFAIAAED
jgi:hypothetical protein